MSRACKAFRTTIFLFAASLSIAGLASADEADNMAACCDGLESRIAELEAASVNKGTRNVTLQIYGQVNRALLFWNDSFNSKFSIVDNTTSSSRLGFIGQGNIRAGLVAGYRLELEFLLPASSEIFNPSDITHTQALTNTALRQAYWFVSDERLGMVSVGHQWSATGDLTIINLGSQMNDAALHYNNAFSLGLSLGGGIFSDLKWGQIVHSVDTLRANYLRYDTPSLLGFVFSASVGETDSWDIALRYQANGQAFRFAAGVGYREDHENLMTELKGAASLLHHATGLYASVAGGLRDAALSSIIGNPPASFYYVQAGISRKWLTFGNTTVYGDLGVYRNFNVGALLRVDSAGQLVTWGTLAETEVFRWGYGVEQAFDDSGLLLYAQAHHYEPQIIGFPCDANPGQFANQCGGDPSNLVSLPMRPWQAFVVGARVRF